VAFEPPGGPGVRVDSGVSAGAKVTAFYDPMIAKLVCWGRDRDEAIERTRRALGEFVVRGIKTTIPFHRRALENRAFLSGRYDTSFISSEMPARAPLDAGVAG
jgi:acetyl-CoA carboxylase biotin carboxylase subunit